MGVVTTEADVDLQLATAADAEVVREVYLRSWRAGYAGLIDERAIEEGAARRGAHDWAAEVGRSDCRFVIARVDGTPAGVAAVGDDPTEAVGGTWLDLLYVAPEYWGTQVALSLHTWVIDDCRTRGLGSLRLRVVSAQARARRFYEREGWLPDPDVPPSSNDYFPLLCLRFDLETRHAPRQVHLRCAP